MRLNKINDNILANRWKLRYEALPAVTKERLDQLNTSNLSEYQLKEIKRSRKYPQIGDVVRIKPNQEITLFGIVINNHINNINGEDLLLVAILKPGIDLNIVFGKGISPENLLFAPVMVGKEYWTKGFFAKESEWKTPRINVQYGFLRLINGKFLDEHGDDIGKEPELLGSFSVTTISGIARKINQELIIEGVL